MVKHEVIMRMYIRLIGLLLCGANALSLYAMDKKLRRQLHQCRNLLS